MLRPLAVLLALLPAVGSLAAGATTPSTPPSADSERQIPLHHRLATALLRELRAGSRAPSSTETGSALARFAPGVKDVAAVDKGNYLTARGPAPALDELEQVVRMLDQPLTWCRVRVRVLDRWPDEPGPGKPVVLFQADRQVPSDGAAVFDAPIVTGPGRQPCRLLIECAPSPYPDGAASVRTTFIEQPSLTDGIIQAPGMVFRPHQRGVMRLSLQATLVGGRRLLWPQIVLPGDRAHLKAPDCVVEIVPEVMKGGAPHELR